MSEKLLVLSWNCPWADHVAKIITLGAMDQNNDLLAKMPKIVVF